MDQIPIWITYGHPKNGRKDLKQFLISIITTTQADLPIWVATLSGNTSDKTHFRETIKDYAKRLIENKEDAFFVMDSAMYTAKNVKALSPICQWISRVPETINKAKDLIIASDTDEMDESTLEGYRFKAHPESYAGVEQNWVVVFSEQAYKREVKTLNKNIRKEGEKLLKDVWHFGNNEFKCEEDGRKAMNTMVKKWKYHRMTACAVTMKNKTGKRGRPKKDAKAVKTIYHLKVSFEKDKEKIETAMKRKGKFIIATNNKALDPDEALKEYKGLQGVERGFRFIKDPLFFASSVFLKSPKRIVSLVMIMALSLLVYSLAQYKLRKALVDLKETLPDQKKKPTVKPTMRWIFQQFEGIHLLLYEEKNGAVRKVLNLNDVHRKVLKLLGSQYEKTYLLE
jgi:transposase